VDERAVSFFEVPPDADETFVSGWQRAGASPTLHRALRTDVALRFVHVAHEDVDLRLPGFPAHAARYGVVHDDGEPEAPGGVILINPFEVPADEDESFLTAWARVHELFAARQGYLGTRLHLSTGPADFRFVDLVRWSSPLMYARTLQQPDVGLGLAAMPFRGRPALYLRVDG
jgi:hypothetical protein